jgi:hypothetical protein
MKCDLANFSASNSKCGNDRITHFSKHHVMLCIHHKPPWDTNDSLDWRQIKDSLDGHDDYRNSLLILFSNIVAAWRLWHTLRPWSWFGGWGLNAFNVWNCLASRKRSLSQYPGISPGRSIHFFAWILFDSQMKHDWRVEAPNLLVLIHKVELRVFKSTQVFW